MSRSTDRVREARPPLAARPLSSLGSPANDAPDNVLRRENAMLATRNNQLQGDVLALTVEIQRLRQVADRLQRRLASMTGAPAPVGEDR